MSEFAVVYDPVRNSPFAIVVRDNDSCEIKALNARAQSWANSQFYDIEVPNGMAITEYKALTESAQNVIENYEFVDPQAIKKIADKKYAHSHRSKRDGISGKSSSLPIRRFGKNGRSSIIDFKAKKFIALSKKSSINKNSIKNSYIRSEIGSGTMRRLSVSAKSFISCGSENRRVSRRLRDISTTEVKSTPNSSRINFSILTKHVGFRQL